MQDNRSGIYEIVNTVNGKSYVGSAAKLRARWLQHLSHLRRGIHHSLILQRAWDKYGASSFEFRPLLVCALEHLVMFEQRAIDVIKPAYNVSPTAGSNRGHKMSDAFKARVSKQWKGVSPSEETRKKISESLKGRPTGWVATEEQLAALSVRTKAWRASPEGLAHSERLAALKRGVPRTSDTRIKTGKSLARLTDDQVRELRRKYASGVLQSVLASEYEVAKSCISEIVCKKTYKWVD